MAFAIALEIRNCPGGTQHNAKLSADVIAARSLTHSHCYTLLHRNELISCYCITYIEFAGYTILPVEDCFTNGKCEWEG